MSLNMRPYKKNTRTLRSSHTRKPSILAGLACWLLLAAAPVQAERPGAEERIANTATATHDGFVTNTDDGSQVPAQFQLTSNTVVATTPPAPDAIEITKTSDAVDGVVSPGEQIIFTLEIENTSTATATPLIGAIVDGGAECPQGYFIVRDEIPRNLNFNRFVPPLDGATALYHRYDAASEQNYTTTRPASDDDIEAIAFGICGGLPAGETRSFRFEVEANRGASGNTSNTAFVYFDTNINNPIPSNTVELDIDGTPSINNYPNNNFSDGNDPVNIIQSGDELFIEAPVGACNSDPDVAEQYNVLLTVENTGDEESFNAVETAPNSGIFRVLNDAGQGNNGGIRTESRNPGISQNNIVDVTRGSVIDITFLGTGVNGSDCGQAQPTTEVLVDPFAVVFDSGLNNTPEGAGNGVPNAVVTLYDPAGQSHLDDDGNLNPNAANCGGLQPTADRHPVFGARACVYDANGDLIVHPTFGTGATVTDSQGRYSLPFVTENLDYILRVDPPDNFLFVSAADPQDGDPQTINPGVAGQFNLDDDGSFGREFRVGDEAVVIDIPVDPDNGGIRFAMLIDKQVSPASAEIGEIVSYTVELLNDSDSDIRDIVFNDTMPFGFVFIPGSARITAPGETDSVAVIDPQPVGNTLQFRLNEPLLVSESATLTYRARLGPGSIQGDGTNLIVATGTQAETPVSSNRASATVKVDAGVFTDRGFIVGKVYLECSFDRVQGHEEIGVPGVRIYLQDGSWVITDSEGKYSFAGLAARTHVLKLDSTTLPKGWEPKPLSNRHAGVGTSRFVDLRSGELHRADFADGGCSELVVAQVKGRRDAGEVFTAEVEKVLDQELLLDERNVDLRSLPASGLSELDRKTDYEGILNPARRVKTDFAAIDSVVNTAQTARVDLETLLPTLNNEFGFVDLKDGEVTARRVLDIIVKGTNGASFKLMVNGQEVPSSRVGQKSSLASTQIQAWEYISVALREGANTVTAKQIDPFGNERGSQTVTLIAPGEATEIVLTVPDDAIADGITPVVVTANLLDARGVALASRIPITLETEDGRWEVEDLDEVEPGVQTFITGSDTEFLLVGPSDPGKFKIRAASGQMVTEAEVHFLPELRPMIANGLIEGAINFSDLGKNIVPVVNTNSFERELSGLNFDSSDGRLTGGIRAALFLKGQVLGKYLLTAAYDSEKETDLRLFRDIQPDRFYPVYGDSSVKGFDAQSTSSLYVRIDSGNSYALFGDFSTPSEASVLGLSRYNRSLTGGIHHFENDFIETNAWVSYDRASKVVDKFEPKGLTGPYKLSEPEGYIENSEQVFIAKLSRSNLAVEEEREQLTRFIDYTVDPLTNEIFLRQPLLVNEASTGPTAGRPQILVIEYEVDDGGAREFTGGIDATVHLSDAVSLSASLTRDDSAGNEITIIGTGVEIEFTDNLVAAAEYAMTEDVNGDRGSAYRGELKYDGSRLRARLHAGRSDELFSNRSASLSEGREEAGIEASADLWAGARASGELRYDKNTSTNTTREEATAAISQSIGQILDVEVGLRHTAITSEEDENTIRGRLTAKAADVPFIPYVDDASVFVEYEQDLEDTGNSELAIGGELQVADRARLYARHELNSSLRLQDSGLGTSTLEDRRLSTIVGIETDYLGTGTAFSEYRLRDADDGRSAEAAIGVQNQWPIAEGVTINGSLQQIQVISGPDDGDSLAATIGVEYTRSPLWKATSRIEYRHSNNSDDYLWTAGLGRKLSRSWVFLGRNTYNRTVANGTDGNSGYRNRLQLGFAYRDTDRNRWNLLARYELEIEKDDNRERYAHIISANANWQPKEGWAVSGRYASKWIDITENGSSDSYLLNQVLGRVTYDISERWDIGATASTFFSEDGNYYGVGLEVGYLLWSNLWASVGYNFFGYNSDEAPFQEFTSNGVYLKFRYKFDENLFDRYDPDVNNTLPRAMTDSQLGSLERLGIQAQKQAAQPAPPVVQPVTQPAPQQIQSTSYLPATYQQQVQPQAQPVYRAPVQTVQQQPVQQYATTTVETTAYVSPQEQARLRSRAGERYTSDGVTYEMQADGTAVVVSGSVRSQTVVQPQSYYVPSQEVRTETRSYVQQGVQQQTVQQPVQQRYQVAPTTTAPVQQYRYQPATTVTQPQYRYAPAQQAPTQAVPQQQIAPQQRYVPQQQYVPQYRYQNGQVIQQPIQQQVVPPQAYYPQQRQRVSGQIQQPAATVNQYQQQYVQQPSQSYTYPNQ